MHGKVRHDGGHLDAVVRELLRQLARDPGAQVEKPGGQRSVVEEEATGVVLEARPDEIHRTGSRRSTRRDFVEEHGHGGIDWSRTEGFRSRKPRRTGSWNDARAFVSRHPWNATSDDRPTQSKSDVTRLTKAPIPAAVPTAAAQSAALVRRSCRRCVKPAWKARWYSTEWP